MATTNPTDDSLLIVLPLRYRRVNGDVHFESQAANGLSLWADHFSRVIVACPVVPESEVARIPNTTWTPANQIRNIDRIEFFDLPSIYGARGFFKAKKSIAPKLGDLIDRARYLHFALGGWIGDWGTVASRVAAEKGRQYSVWTDRVEHEVTRRAAKNAGSFKRRLHARLTWRPMRSAHHRAIKHAAVGLFHGRECFDAYGPWSKRPELVHDIHIKAADRLSEAAMFEKRAHVAVGGPLRIVYAGRAVAMKGPLDWVRVIGVVASAGVDVRASWLGDGDDLPQMKSLASELKIAGRIDFAGFVNDRERLLNALRESDLLVFCHKTPESPRILIESLVSATPIVGYGSAFPADLISGHQGGRLTPLNDVDALAKQIIELARDRGTLSTLIESAWHDGAPFNDAAVFTHRSEIIKHHT